MNKLVFPIILVCAGTVLGCAPFLHDAYIQTLFVNLIATMPPGVSTTMRPLAPSANFTIALLAPILVICGIILGWKMSTVGRNTIAPHEG